MKGEVEHSIFPTCVKYLLRRLWHAFLRVVPPFPSWRRSRVPAETADCHLEKWKSDWVHDNEVAAEGLPLDWSFVSAMEPWAMALHGRTFFNSPWMIRAAARSIALFEHKFQVHSHSTSSLPVLVKYLWRRELFQLSVLQRQVLPRFLLSIKSHRFGCDHCFRQTI